MLHSPIVLPACRMPNSASLTAQTSLLLLLMPSMPRCRFSALVDNGILVKLVSTTLGFLCCEALLTISGASEAAATH